ncbi:acyl-homoserine-lactone synthase [Martelella sp. HB161492]|uniref:acyl-homoserine-lactone synthase n=1 Tax=Martelella sp. HB161492 TaxID=2720726 RepID=UPI001590BC2D|nr:acyl-homoserine-lactone synthase [Martelella sp. HB161492]
MFVTIQEFQQQQYADLVDQFLRLRKKTFADQLGWEVQVSGDREADAYDRMNPVYLLWCSDDRKTLYGGMRLMPTTGPTLLYDVFRSTFPGSIDLVAPGIWEGTRMCLDDEAVQRDHEDMSPGYAFSLLLLALCECALDHGIHTMISNYEPHMKRVYRRSGVEVDELGRADGYGRHPVCCGAFEVSDEVMERMRAKLGVTHSLFTNASAPQPGRALMASAA